MMRQRICSVARWNQATTYRAMSTTTGSNTVSPTAMLCSSAAFSVNNYSHCTGTSKVSGTGWAVGQQQRFASSSSKAAKSSKKKKAVSAEDKKKEQGNAIEEIQELKLLKIDMGQMRSKGQLRQSKQLLYVNDHNAADPAAEMVKAAVASQLELAPEEKFPEHMSWLFDFDNGDLNSVLQALLQEQRSEPQPNLIRQREIQGKLRALTNTLLYHVPSIRKNIKVPDVNVDHHLENAVKYPLPESLRQPLGMDEISIQLPSALPVMWHPFMQQFVYTLDTLLPLVEEAELQLETLSEAEGGAKKDSNAEAPVDLMLPVMIRDFFALVRKLESNLKDDLPKKLQDLAKIEEMKFWIKKITPTLEKMLAEHTVKAKELSPVRLPTCSEYDGDNVTIPNRMVPIVRYIYQRKGISGPQASRAAITGIPVFSHVVTDFKAAHRDAKGDALDFITKAKVPDFLKHNGSSSLWLDLGYCLHANPPCNTNALLRVVEPQHKVLIESADHFDYITDGKNSGFLLYFNLERFTPSTTDGAARTAKMSQSTALKRTMANVPLLLDAAAEMSIAGEAATTKDDKKKKALNSVFAKGAPEAQKSVMFPIRVNQATQVHEAFSKVSNNIKYHSFDTHTLVHMFVPASFDAAKAVIEIIGEDRARIGLNVCDQKDFNKMGSNCLTVSSRTTNPRALLRLASEWDAKAIYPGKYCVARLRPYMHFIIVFNQAITEELHRKLTDLPKPQRESELLLQGSGNTHLEAPLRKFTHDRELLMYREKKAAQDAYLVEWQSVSVGQQLKQLVSQVEKQNLSAVSCLDRPTLGFLGARTHQELSELKEKHSETKEATYDLPLLFHPSCRHWAMVSLKKDAFEAVEEEGGHLVARDENNETWMEAVSMKSMQMSGGGFDAVGEDDADDDEDDDDEEDEDAHAEAEETTAEGGDEEK